MRPVILGSILGTLILSISLAFILSGCSNTITATTITSINVSWVTGTAPVMVGGLSIASPGDTLVNVDLELHDTVSNTTSSALNAYALWTFDSLNPHDTNFFAGFLGIRDSLYLGPIHPRGSIVVDTIIQVAVPQPSARIKLFSDLDIGWWSDVHAASIEWSGSDSVPFSSRWRGVIHTVESSPTPIDTLDGPDDGDWQPNGVLTPTPAYPNPSTGATTLGFSIPELLDSVRADLYLTPHHVIRPTSGIHLPAGMHKMTFDLSGLKPGLYRMIVTAYKNGIAGSYHGDIMIPLP